MKNFVKKMTLIQNWIVYIARKWYDWFAKDIIYKL